MKFHFSHPHWLWVLPLVWAWLLVWAWRSDVQVAPWRRWTALALRLGVATALALALAGLRWLEPREGVNVYFLLDRSDSIPSPQQEAARRLANAFAEHKKQMDRAGLLVFAAEAALETTPSEHVDPKEVKVLAVIGTERTDIAAGIRLATAAFPETGQKRLVLFSDGNENLGDALAAAAQARALGVSLDVVPLGVGRGRDVSVQKLVLPNRVKLGQSFEAKVFAQADQAGPATLRVYRNEQLLGSQPVQLEAGKNLLTFPQKLEAAGFYAYTAHLEAAGDLLPQNNQASAFLSVRGEPRVLLVSSAPEQDAALAAALLAERLNLQVSGVEGLPRTLEALQHFDAVFLCNVSAGDLGQDNMKRLESAVRDFGVGLVCVGGDNAFTAGAYRGTPLETTLPVNMELESKKVLPKGAVALVMHGMEFGNGNQISRECALGVLEALGPQDELGVNCWDGAVRWVVPLSPVGNKAQHGRRIAGMNQGDLPDFEGVMSLAFEALKKSSANLKHLVVFSDGDPAPPSERLMKELRAARITVSTVLISGHAGPETMIWMAERGGGRFYNVTDPSQLPQVFIKEAAVILKSAIFEEPFVPRQVAGSEILRGLGAAEYPVLAGYVCTTPKTRAEVPLVTDKDDPLLAHWQFGLGRAVAFTSDAKAKWARAWVGGWPKYRQFWTQLAQWSLRRLENADFTTELSVEGGEGHLSVEAVDEKGDFRNFLQLEAVVVSPKGERQTVRLEQTGAGHYEGRFATREVGAYIVNLRELQAGRVAGVQVVGTSINYSPEFAAPEPNLALLTRLAETGGGKLLDPSRPALAANNPFLHDRRKTYQPHDWWEALVRLAVALFVLDVGLRRVQLDREDWLKALAWLRRLVVFWKPQPRPAPADESLAALLARRNQVRQMRAPSSEFRVPSGPAVPGGAGVELPVSGSESRVPAPEAAARPAEDAPRGEEAKPAPAQPEAAPPESTARRLLEAKKRARQKLE